MLKIKILGSYCRRCQRLENNVNAALRESNTVATVEKVVDIDRFIHYGIIRIPALVIDEEIVLQGAVLPVADIKKVFEKLIRTHQNRSESSQSQPG